jgi:hypothetical protein
MGHVYGRIYADQPAFGHKLNIVRIAPHQGAFPDNQIIPAHAIENFSPGAGELVGRASHVAQPRAAAGNGSDFSFCGDKLSLIILRQALMRESKIHFGKLLGYGIENRFSFNRRIILMY